MPNEGLQQQIDLLATFIQNDLRKAISGVEGSIPGVSSQSVGAFLQTRNIGSDLLSAAAEIKRVSSQIDVIVHALGILHLLPHILLPQETVESVSLGAGNTGRAFDLETNLRIAEFKFITWRGGSETIRQNGIFKDFFDLACAETSKKRYLYLLGTYHPLKFFRGRRALSSVLSKNQATKEKFERLYGDRYRTVDQFYLDHSHLVEIVDVSAWIPQLMGLPSAEPLSEEDV
jgi:hypothetical protein